MRKKILISGGKGKLASELIKFSSSFNILCPSKKEMNLTSLDDIESYIKSFQPDYFIHAGAYTKPMQKHQDNPVLSIQTNIIGTCNVAIACLESKTKLIYISTDYVYPGTDGNYREEDPVSPFSKANDGIYKYGWSKLGGECAVRFLDNYLILRACLSDYPFPHKIAFKDIKKSYIYTKNAAEIIIKVLDQKGILNLGGEPLTVFEFASKSNKEIISMNHKEITNLEIAPDTTMNIDKLKDII